MINDSMKPWRTQQQSGIGISQNDSASHEDSVFTYYFKPKVRSNKRRFQTQRRVVEIRLPNDKLSKVVFTRTPEQMRRMIEEQRDFKLVELSIKGNPVKTTYRLKHVDGYADMEPLNEFDRAVMGVCISAIEAGMSFTTVKAIYRVLCGGKSHNAYSSTDIQARILESLERLSKTTISVDMKSVCKAVKKYGKNLAKSAFTSPLLPCEIVDGEVNGQPAQIVCLPREPPLMTVARAKEQVLTYGVELLDVGSRNTATTVMLKSYVLRRVLEAKAHARNMSPKITFADVFKHCGLENATRWQRQDARKVIFALMERLQAATVIQSFEKEKVACADTGAEFVAITVVYGDA